MIKVNYKFISNDKKIDLFALKEFFSGLKNLIPESRAMQARV